MYRRRGKAMGAKNEKNRARQMAIAPTHYHSVRAGICCSKGFFFSWVGGEVQNEMHILLKGQPIFFHLFYAPFEENQDHQMGRCQDTATPLLVIFLLLRPFDCLNLILHSKFFHSYLPSKSSSSPYAHLNIPPSCLQD